MKIATDILQSKLAEILPIESADMFWLVTSKPKLHVRDDEPLSNYDRWEHYPAWSLSALIAIMPEKITDKEDIEYHLNVSNGLVEYYNSFIGGLSEPLHSIKTGDTIDSAFEMVCWLHENDLI